MTDECTVFTRVNFERQLSRIPDGRLAAARAERRQWSSDHFDGSQPCFSQSSAPMLLRYLAQISRTSCKQEPHQSCRACHQEWGRSIVGCCIEPFKCCVFIHLVTQRGREQECRASSSRNRLSDWSCWQRVSRKHNVCCTTKRLTLARLLQDERQWLGGFATVAVRPEAIHDCLDY